MLSPQAHAERDGTLRFCRSRTPACGPPASSSQQSGDLDHRVRCCGLLTLTHDRGGAQKLLGRLHVANLRFPRGSGISKEFAFFARSPCGPTYCGEKRPSWRP